MSADLVVRAGNLHISSGPVVNASRIFKQTSSVARSGLFTDVIICAKARDGLPREEQLTEGRRIERIGLATDDRQPSVLRRVQDQLTWSRAVFKHYANAPVSAVNAHSVAVLPVAYLLSRRLGAKLIYDTHEVETETCVSKGVQRAIYKLTERLLIAKCDAVFVVNELIADWYRRRYPGVQPVVVRNVSKPDSSGRPTDLRKLLAVPAEEHLFIFTGSLSEGRNIPAILKAFATPAVSSHIVFLGGGGKFDAMVRDYCEGHPNIHLRPAVPPAEVVGHVATCDVGLCLTEPTCLSHQLTLPNKAFEYAQAGLPFFFTNLPAVASLLGPSFDGWRVAEPARDLAAAITALTTETIEKGRADLAAIRFPGWDEEAEAMMAAYRGLINPA